MENLIKFFNSTVPLSEKVLSLMGKIFVQGELKKGAYFIEKGQLAKEIAFLETGIVRAFYVNNEGKV